MDLAILQGQRRLLVRQQITPMVNRYVVHTGNPDGSEGEPVAFAERKRPSLPDRITFYTDDARREAIAGFTARTAADPASGYDVVNGSGEPIGYFRKDSGASRLRSTWHLQQPGLPTLTGRERNIAVALLRRIGDGAARLPYHFDFGVGAHIAFSVVRRLGAPDRYTVTVNDHRLDRRLVIATAVALDALRAR